MPNGVKTYNRVDNALSAATRRLQTGVNIGGDVLNIVLQYIISVFQVGFYLLNGIQNRGMVTAEFLSNIRQAEVGQLPHQIHGDLPCLRSSLAFIGTPQYDFVNIVEPADLADDQTRCRQCTAFGFKHIGNGTGNVVQIHRHFMQIPVSHDLFDGAFNLTNIIGDVIGDVM